MILLMLDEKTVLCQAALDARGIEPIFCTHLIRQLPMLGRKTVTL